MTVNFDEMTVNFDGQRHARTVQVSVHVAKSKLAVAAKDS